MTKKGYLDGWAVWSREWGMRLWWTFKRTRRESIAKYCAGYRVSDWPKRVERGDVRCEKTHIGGEWEGK